MKKVTIAILIAILSLAILANTQLQAQRQPSKTPTAVRTPTSSSKPNISLQVTVTATANPPATQPLTTSTPISAPLVYVIAAGDSLLAIATRYDVDLDLLVAENEIADPNFIRIGQRITIPGHSISIDPNAPTPTPASDPAEPTFTPTPTRPSIIERMTVRGQRAPTSSPFYKTTWLTYYGRPSVGVMGILGEYEIDELSQLLQEKADAYDEANGAELGVTPAFHLVWGMATKAPGDGSHLNFLSDELTRDYISAALESDYQVILDIQIGALTPVQALTYGFEWLQYENVHLALDPEFAISYDGQAIPGNPAGYVTAAEINEAQAAMQLYMQKNKIRGKRVLLIHQFLETMIIDKEEIASDFAGIEVVISVDGWGPPAGKVSKYNLFVDETTPFSSFKLFYRWDVPVMSEGEALGEESINGYDYINVTPNMIIYQ